MSPQSIVPSDRLLRRSREALSTMGLVFLLGMGANLIGTPADNSDGSRVIAGIVLGLHVLIAIGVIVVAVRLFAAARQLDLGLREATWALIVVCVTFLFGVGTMLTDSGWLSFLMAAGFLAAAALYVRTAVLGARAARAVA